MINKIILIVILSTVLLSCQNENIIYNKNLALSPKVEWLKSDVREFIVPISETNLECKMSLNFRYATGYSFPNVLVKITETSPSGKVKVYDYDLKIVNENGDYIGDAGLDIWDSKHLVETNKVFNESGNYTFVIEQNTPVDPLNYAMEIGLLLEKK